MHVRMDSQEYVEDIIPESYAARAAWRCSLIPVLGIPHYILFAFIALFQIGSGRTGLSLLRRGAIAIFLINILPYFGFYFSGYTLSYPRVYNCLYFPLPKHGVLRSYCMCGDVSTQLHFRFWSKTVKVESFYHSSSQLSREGYYIETGPDVPNIFSLPIGNGKPIGKWTLWYYNGNKCGEGEYDTFNNEIGTWTYWSPDEKEKSSMSFTTPGRGTGKLWREVDEGILEMNYVNGNLEGVFRRWSVKGEKLEEGHYVNGEKIGFWQEYNDAKEYSSGEYRSGQRIGKWEIRDVQGKLIRVENNPGIDPIEKN